MLTYFPYSLSSKIAQSSDVLFVKGIIYMYVLIFTQQEKSEKAPGVTECMY